MTLLSRTPRSTAAMPPIFPGNLPWQPLPRGSNSSLPARRVSAYPSSFRLGRSVSLFFRRHFRGMRRWQEHPASCPNPRHRARHLHFHRDSIDSGPQRRTPGRQHSNHGYRHRPI